MKKFKDISEKIVIAGSEELNQSNITDAKVEALVKRFPALADKFEDVPEDKKTSKEVKS